MKLIAGRQNASGVFAARVAGQGYCGNLTSVSSANSSDQVVPVFDRHAYVGHKHIRFPIIPQLQRLLDVSRGFCLSAAERELERKHFSRVRVIINNQHSKAVESWLSILGRGVLGRSFAERLDYAGQGNAKLRS